MRLDKYLASCGVGTRTEVKKILKQKKVSIAGQIEINPKLQINEATTAVCVAGQQIIYVKYQYFLLNKPTGVITATKDKNQKTVLDCIHPNDWQEDLFPVGRLDKDTTGLVLITNDGSLAHKLLSPKKHIKKVYSAVISGEVNSQTIKKFSKPMRLKNGDITKPADLVLKEYSAKRNISQVIIAISEGKYHQIKRMFAANGMHVEALQRIKMGNLILPSELKQGEYRRLTEKEVENLKVQ